jgi:hypothetical protein
MRLSGAYQRLSNSGIRASTSGLPRRAVESGTGVASVRASTEVQTNVMASKKVADLGFSDDF